MSAKRNDRPSLESTLKGHTLTDSYEKFRQYLREEDGAADMEVSDKENDLLFFIRTSNISNMNKEDVCKLGEDFFDIYKITLPDASRRARLQDNLKIGNVDDLDWARSEVRIRLVSNHENWLVKLFDQGELPDRSTETALNGGLGK